MTMSAKACPGPLPPVFLSMRDFGRLERLAHVHRGAYDEAVASFLSAELDRAIVCRDGDLPRDVVTMRARVLFRVGADRDVESRVLVYPEDYDPSGGALSVLTPLGVALLGLREGSAMRYATLDGAMREVAVEKIAWRPDWRPPISATSDGREAP